MAKTIYPRINQTLPSGSEVHWEKCAHGKVPVTCGGCKKRRHVDASAAIKETFKGLHPKCRTGRLRSTGVTRTGIEKLPKGATVHWEVFDPNVPSGTKRRVQVTGVCGHTWYVRPPVSKAAKGWIGALCRKCRAIKRASSERVPLPKGTVVVYDKRERVKSRSGKDKPSRVAIECRGCFNETGELKYVWLSTIQAYLRGENNWGELCSECHGGRGPSKISDERVATSGTVIQFQLVNESGEVPIRYELCRCEESVPRRRAIMHWKEWPDACPKHNNPEARGELISDRKFAKKMAQQAGAVNGNGQNNGGVEKRKRGHQAGDLVHNRDRLKADFENMVKKLRETLPAHKIRRRVIAGEYHRRGERIHESTVTKRVQLIYGDGIDVADAVARALDA